MINLTKDMIKKILLALLTLIIIGLFIVVFYVADRVDASFNTTYIEKPYTFTERTSSLSVLMIPLLRK